MLKLFLLFFTLSFQYCESINYPMYWWQSPLGKNFGDELSKVIVERILGHPVEYQSLSINHPLLLAAGSILHFARDGDVIWGAGFRENPTDEHRFEFLDIRAVRGPKTYQFLREKGIHCPKIYGDPAILMAHLFPEFQRNEPIVDYIIMPNVGELEYFSLYKNVVSPLLPWDIVISKILEAKLVISGSLHGIIVAESFEIPARLLKMTWMEPLLKYEDYYESTGRPDFQYATSVFEAIKMGGETPGYIDPFPLLFAFPWDYFAQYGINQA